MSGNLSVVVLTPNGRRNVVKCNSNTTILQILEQTCLKHGFQPDEYDLMHHRHVLDTSSTFRFSGLPNNASLEMVQAKKVRKETEVVVALQVENGERVMGNFLPSSSLYTVISTLAPDQSDPETHPVVIYMRNEVYGEEALKSTTLKSLGLTGGKAILRLLHRTPEQLKTQANVSSPLISKPRDTEDVSFNSTSIFSSTKLNDETKEETMAPLDRSTPLDSSLDSNNILNNTFNSESQNRSNSKDEQMEVGELPSTADNRKNLNDKMEIEPSANVDCNVEIDDSHLEDEIVVLGERNALVFSMDMASQLPFEDMPDDFYDLSVNEVRKIFQDLKHQREELENTPLQVSAMKKLEEEKIVLSQLTEHKKVVLRIAFPDRTVLQGTFKPLDSVQTVMDFVKNYLEDSTAPFDLYLSPPKQILSPDLRLIEAKCVPSALIHFGPHVDDAELSKITTKRYLKQNILEKLTSPEAATFSASKTRGIVRDKNTSASSADTSPKMPCISNDDKMASRSEPFSVPGPSRAKDPKVPKWFKPS